MSTSEHCVVAVSGKPEISQEQLTLPLLTAAKNYDFHQLKDAIEQLEIVNVEPKNVLELLHSALDVLLKDEFQGHIKEDAMLKCINILVDYTKSASDTSALEELVNVRKGKYEESPLSLAVYNGFERASDILVRCGADTAIRTPRFRGPHSLATAIASTMPDVMMHILDSGVELLEFNENGKEENTKKEILETTRENTIVLLDWRPILQYSSETHLGKQKHRHLQKESSFLYSLLDIPPSRRNRYLTHPLVSAFLHLKRSSISKRFRGVQFLLSTFPIFYMVFMYFLYFNRCKMEEDECGNNSTGTTNSLIIKAEDANNCTTERQRCDITPAISVAAYMLSVFVGGCAAFEVYMLLRVDITYMKSWRTWVIRVSIIVMACTLWPALQFNTLYNITWQYPIAAIGTFLAWVMFLIQMELIPVVKVYLEMLVAVVISVLKITLLFLPLLIGFYMGFYLMFFKFGNIMNFVLMTVDIGSNEYENMLDNPKDSRTWFKVIAFTFSAAFIIIIGVVFINFLLGASINDIQELRRMAKIMTLSNKVQNHFIIDLVFSRRYNVVKVKNVNKVTKEELRWIYRPRENDFIGQEPGRKLNGKIRGSLIQLLKVKAGAIENGRSSPFDIYEEDVHARMDRLENRMNSIADGMIRDQNSSR